MNYRSILPAAAIGALLSVSACSDPALDDGGEAEMEAEAPPTVDEYNQVQDLPPETTDADPRAPLPPPPRMTDPPVTDPIMTEPAEPETGGATAAEPVAE